MQGRWYDFFSVDVMAGLVIIVGVVTVRFLDSTS